MQDEPQKPDNFDQISTALLLSDADLALTFVHRAETTTDVERRRESVQRARRAYESICTSITLVRATTPELATLGAKLQTLKAALDALEPGEGAPTSL